MTSIKVKKYLFLLLITGLIFLNDNAYSQLNNVTFSGGITTLRILGDNPNNSLIIERDTSRHGTPGASYRGVQSGFGLKANFGMDKNDDFIIPLGFEYYFMRGYERIPISKRTSAFLRNSTDMPVISLGLLYKFVELPWADVKGFVGVDGKASFILQGDYYYRIEYGQLDSVELVSVKTKPSTVRFGGYFSLGFEGDLYDNFMINTTASIGVINLFGRDNVRGELFTRNNDYETKETILYTFNFALSIMYRF